MSSLIEYSRIIENSKINPDMFGETHKVSGDLILPKGQKSDKKKVNCTYINVVYIDRLFTPEKEIKYGTMEVMFVVNKVHQSRGTDENSASKPELRMKRLTFDRLVEEYELYRNDAKFAQFALEKNNKACEAYDAIIESYKLYFDRIKSIDPVELKFNIHEKLSGYSNPDSEPKISYRKYDVVTDEADEEKKLDTPRYSFKLVFDRKTNLLTCNKYNKGETNYVYHFSSKTKKPYLYEGEPLSTLNVDKAIPKGSFVRAEVLFTKFYISKQVVYVKPEVQSLRVVYNNYKEREEKKTALEEEAESFSILNDDNRQDVVDSIADRIMEEDEEKNTRESDPEDEV